MAKSAASILNGLIAEITGDSVTPHFVANTTSPTQNYGYTGSQLYVKLNGVQYNVSSENEAVEKGVLWALPLTKVIGGDLFVKRAIKNAVATDLSSLTGAIQTAKDYENYLANSTIINAYIKGAYSSLTQAEQDFYTNNKALVDKFGTNGVAALTSTELAIYNGSTNGIANSVTVAHVAAAVKNQAVANPWLVTLEAVNELALNQWASSDFYGGLQGFLQSFGMDQSGTGLSYQDVNLSWDGTNLTITDANAPRLFSIFSQASSSGTSVTINNFNTIMSGSASVGGNIIIGTNSGNNITAGTADTWIQGAPVQTRCTGEAGMM